MRLALQRFCDTGLLDSRVRGNDGRWLRGGDGSSQSFQSMYMNSFRPKIAWAKSVRARWSASLPWDARAADWRERNLEANSISFCVGGRPKARRYARLIWPDWLPASDSSLRANSSALSLTKGSF